MHGLPPGQRLFLRSHKLDSFALRCAFVLQPDILLGRFGWVFVIEVFDTVAVHVEAFAVFVL